MSKIQVNVGAFIIGPIRLWTEVNREVSTVPRCLVLTIVSC